jgi:hypothetical protein
MGRQLVAWNFEQLLEAVASLPTPRLLGVDGLTLSGKSWAAKRVAREFGWRHLDGDDFIRDGNQPHPYALDLAALGQQLEEDSKPIVLSTVMLHAVLDAVGLPPSASIYVRHRNLESNFARPEFYENFQPDQILAEVEDFCRIMGYGVDEPLFDRQFVHYHLRYAPMSNATVLFENVHAGS